MNIQKVKLLNLPIEWERGQGLRKSDINTDGKNKCILYGELYTKHKKMLVSNDELSKTDANGRMMSMKGDVLVPGTSTAEKSKMLLAREVSQDGVLLGGDINIIRPQKGLFAEKFLPYYFETNDAFKQLERYITGATGIIHISNKGLKQLNVPKLELEEQEKIVSILDEAFEKIEQAKANIEKNIENTEELVESSKQKIFEKLVSEFEVKPIIAGCEQIFAGGDAPKDNMSTEKTDEFSIPIIANAVKENGLYGYTDKARVTKPSITVAARGSGTGHTEYRDYPFLPIVRLIVLTPDTDILEAQYLLYAIKSLVIKRSGSAIPQLTVPMMKSYSIPMPDIDTQREVVSDMNNLVEHMADYKTIMMEKLNLLAELKKSILQKAFTGELTNKTVKA